MKIQNIIESISSIVYHSTSPRNAVRILKSNRFTLSSAASNREKDLNSGNIVYWLSTARSPRNSFSDNISNRVTFELDGRKLSYRYSGKPVNFFSKSKTLGQSPEYDEMEDRIFSKTRYIDNVNTYITSIVCSSETGIITTNEMLMFKDIINHSNGLNVVYYSKGKKVSQEQFIQLPTYEDDVPDSVSDDSKEIVSGIMALMNGSFDDYKHFKSTHPKSIEYINGNNASIIEHKIRNLLSTYSHNENIDVLINHIQKNYKGSLVKFSEDLFKRSVTL